MQLEIDAIAGHDGAESFDDVPELTAGGEATGAASPPDAVVGFIANRRSFGSTLGVRRALDLAERRGEVPGGDRGIGVVEGGLLIRGRVADHGAGFGVDPHPERTDRALGQLAAEELGSRARK